ncbi:MAG: hypothetical protein B7Z73_18295, partial [Planctomycetia bacterium 21-64-5]
DRGKRTLLGTIGLASLAGLAYVAYLGIVAIASAGSVNRDDVLAKYDRLFQQATQAQTDPNMSLDPQSAVRFLAKVNEARGPLQNAQPGSTDAQLFEAGTLLIELYASAAASPGTEDAEARHDAEQKYVSMLATIRTELGRAK